jgi:hypothetical protein
MTADKLALSLPEAAALTPYSVDTLRRAIKTSDPNGDIPPLAAQTGPKGRYQIMRDDLVAWLRAFPPA